MRRGVVRGSMVVVAVLASAVTVSLIESASASIGPAASAFVPITPCRLFDTRPGDANVGPRATALDAGDVFTVDVWGSTGNCTIPTTATAVSLNVVSIEPTASSFLTVWPAGADRPTASNLNWTARQAPTPNAVTSALSSTGRLSVFNLAGTVHLAADVVGYFEDLEGVGTGPTGPAGATGTQGPTGPAGPKPLDPANVVTVAPSGADFTDISDALASITDNDASNRYLVQIAPGTYVENAGIDMKDHVDVQGSGPATVIESHGPGAYSTAVRFAGALHTELRDLTIESTGIHAIRVVTTTDAGDVRLTGLDVSVTGTASQAAILLDANGAATIEDTHASATDGVTFNAAIRVLDGSTATIRRSSMSASANAVFSKCYGLTAEASTVTLTDVRAETGNCGGKSLAIEAAAGSQLRAVRVDAITSWTEPGTAWVVDVTDSTATIDQSVVRGAAGSVLGLWAVDSNVIVRDSSVLSAGVDISLRRSGGSMVAIDVIVGGLTEGMSGRCTDVVTQQLDPYTCA